MAASLIEFETAKQHLRIRPDDTSGDLDILVKCDQATAIILNYLKSRADATWTPTTAPGAVVAAALLMLTHLYEHRGDDPKADAELWQAIERLLVRYRDPAVA